MKEQGKNVTIIQPTTAGEDFNDVLNREGIAGVKAYVGSYVSPIEQQADRAVPVKTTLLDKAVSSSHKIAAHLTEQLQLYKDYAGTTIAKEAQQELTAYLSLL